MTRKNETDWRFPQAFVQAVAFWAVIQSGDNACIILIIGGLRLGLAGLKIASIGLNADLLAEIEAGVQVLPVHLLPNREASSFTMETGRVETQRVVPGLDCDGNCFLRYCAGGPR